MTFEGEDPIAIHSVITAGRLEPDMVVAAVRVAGDC